MNRTDLLLGLAAVLVAFAARLVLSTHQTSPAPAPERRMLDADPGAAPAHAQPESPAARDVTPRRPTDERRPAPALRETDRPPDLRDSMLAPWSEGTMGLDDALAFPRLSVERHAALAGLLRRPERLRLEAEMARLVEAGPPARRALTRDLVGAADVDRRTEVALTVLDRAGDVSPHPVLELVSDAALARLVDRYLAWAASRPFDAASWMGLARRSPGSGAWQRLLAAVGSSEQPAHVRKGLFEVLVHAVWSLPTSPSEMALWADLEGTLMRLPRDLAARWVADLARANPVEPILGWERRFGG